VKLFGIIIFFLFFAHSLFAIQGAYISVDLNKNSSISFSMITHQYDDNPEFFRDLYWHMLVWGKQAQGKLSNINKSIHFNFHLGIYSVYLGGDSFRYKDFDANFKSLNDIFKILNNYYDLDINHYASTFVELFSLKTNSPFGNDFVYNNLFLSEEGAKNELENILQWYNEPPSMFIESRIFSREDIDSVIFWVWVTLRKMPT
jgi:hypothetical protein